MHNKEYMLEVLRGKVYGHSLVHLEGHNSAQSATRTVISPGITASFDIDQSSIYATPGTVKVSSSSTDDVATTGTGIWTATLSGLDTSGVVQSEVISFNGQTAVVSANTYSAIHGLRGLTYGSGNTSAGTLWVGTGTVTAGVPATKFLSSRAGYNKAMTAYYVVPANNTLYIRGLALSLSEVTKAVDVTIEISIDGVSWITHDSYGIESGPPASIPINTIEGIAAGYAVRMRGETETGTAKVSAIMDCELVADGY